LQHSRLQKIGSKENQGSEEKPRRPDLFEVEETRSRRAGTCL
jgi:hypothetical protein